MSNCSLSCAIIIYTARGLSLVRASGENAKINNEVKNTKKNHAAPLPCCRALHDPLRRPAPPSLWFLFSVLRVSHCRRWCVPSLVRRLWCRWFILNKLLLPKTRERGRRVVRECPQPGALALASRHSHLSLGLALGTRISLLGLSLALLRGSRGSPLAPRRTDKRQPPRAAQTRHIQPTGRLTNTCDLALWHSYLRTACYGYTLHTRLYAHYTPGHIQPP